MIIGFVYTSKQTCPFGVTEKQVFGSALDLIAAINNSWQHSSLACHVKSIQRHPTFILES